MNCIQNFVSLIPGFEYLLLFVGLSLTMANLFVTTSSVSNLSDKVDELSKVIISQNEEIELIKSQLAKKREEFSTDNLSSDEY